MFIGILIGLMESWESGDSGTLAARFALAMMYIEATTSSTATPESALPYLMQEKDFMEDFICSTAPTPCGC